tara:strand:+ start:1566 stop:1754 length:189 start_codon:yes stop_codon:yes gene_type:complete
MLTIGQNHKGKDRTVTIGDKHGIPVLPVIGEIGIMAKAAVTSSASATIDFIIMDNEGMDGTA